MIEAAKGTLGTQMVSKEGKEGMLEKNLDRGREFVKGKKERAF